jgi:hypothetical protein
LCAAQIYSQETSYFTDDVSSFGNVLKVRPRARLRVPCAAVAPAAAPRPTLPAPSSPQGFDGFLTSKNAQAKNKNRIFRLQDRAFSLSSYTSPAVSPPPAPAACRRRGPLARACCVRSASLLTPASAHLTSPVSFSVS